MRASFFFWSHSKGLSVLNLLANVFGHPGDAQSKLPESVVKEAIERAVDVTDPCVRISSGYAKALVIHAVEYVIKLIDSVPAPVPVNKKGLTDNPAFAALFYSEARMAQKTGHIAARRWLCITHRCA